MIKIDDKGLWREDVGQEIRRMELALFDLNVLYSGAGYPPMAELERAPVMSMPVVEPRAVPSLVGLVGSSVRQTSPVILLGDTWARTWNSLYKIERG